jgi:hypothetical protein
VSSCWGIAFGFLLYLKSQSERAESLLFFLSFSLFLVFFFWYRMANAAAQTADRATSDMLIGPDWSINIELCDIINIDPAQTKDAIKLLKKRLGSKNPKVQILALTALETLSKNCGDVVHQQIVDRDILHDMAKIVKKKPDLGVKEKILSLIDTWQEAFGGAGGKYPQFHAVYRELRAAGVDFPPRTENSVPLFTPPQSVPLQHAPVHLSHEEAAIQASLESNPSPMSLDELQQAQGIADVLSEMLNAIDPAHPQGLKEEVIVDLVEQCRSYQRRITDLVSTTGDEELLIKGLTLNDEIQRVLKRHDEIARGAAPPLNGVPSTAVNHQANSKQSIPPASASVVASAPFSSPFVNVSHEDEEPEDDFSFLSRRTTRDASTAQGKQPFVIPPPVSKNPLPPTSKSPLSTATGTSTAATTGTTAAAKESAPMDFLSGENYGSDSDDEPVLPPPPPPFLTSDHNPGYYTAPKFDEPTAIAKEELPKAPWESSQTQPSVSLPPPPAKYGQRQQYFEQNQYGNNTFAGTGYDGMVNQTRDLSIKTQGNSSKQAKPEDALFKDLVDFAKSKSSSPSSKPAQSRRTR